MDEKGERRGQRLYSIDGPRYLDIFPSTLPLCSRSGNRADPTRAAYGLPSKCHRGNGALMEWHPLALDSHRPEFSLSCPYPFSILCLSSLLDIFKRWQRRRLDVDDEKPKKQLNSLLLLLFLFLYLLLSLLSNTRGKEHSHFLLLASIRFINLLYQSSSANEIIFREKSPLTRRRAERVNQQWYSASFSLVSI